MAQTKQQTLNLRVSRRYAAARERVFDAWTQPELLAQWFSPEGMTNPSVDVDLKEGGRYRVVMQAENGATHTAVGTYREIRRPTKLVFTWAWEAEDKSGHGDETLVTVEFRERGGGTEVTLTHEGFASTDDRDNHAQGWESSLKCLDPVL